MTKKASKPAEVSQSTPEAVVDTPTAPDLDLTQRFVSADAVQILTALRDRGASVLRVVHTADRGDVAQVAHYDGHRWSGVLVVNNGQAIADELEQLEFVEASTIDDGSQGYKLKVQS
jgi:hypothetical protein